MYEYIKGIYKGIKKDYLIIENNGIGYKIFTSGGTIAALPSIDKEVFIYLKQIVREDFIGLYGFATQEELELFTMLLNINGVGTKAALSLLSIGTVNNLKYAIATSDENFITKAPGIGKKTAQRIILELKDKLSKEVPLSHTSENIITNVYVDEALEALIALGYGEKEAEKAIANVNHNMSIEEIIKSCLQLLMK
ncbi:Holliday junction branch migration protein RuvA [Clostridium cellulovorans]|uniref:Holliday junction branch migration complex subunit RuvA n=1 Tax=Clostridium cellulovorans (strain ATCC 35296 / DSM 3052 / OCM 3 / 743B) TaxID=573061 RepID=D9SMW0_CLOC7|nr:Holliday junction branch migration protein RuvA [Clostridium cellulovorans]ADL51826.1 Holliday junction DNA helicase RuvA [Clostridium cellulovorans 743B]